MKRLARLAVSLCIALALPGVPAVNADDGLSADQIVQRWASASGLTERNTATTSARYVITRFGKSIIETVVTKAPNKMWLKSDYTWRHFTEFQGYNGAIAWTANGFGGGGPADPDRARLTIDEAAWYNDAALFRGRMNVKLERLADRTLDGKSYYAVAMTPTGGSTATMFFDKQTFWLAGYSYTPERYDLCTDEVRNESGQVACKTMIAREKGKLDTIITLEESSVNGAVDDVQFAPPQIPPDDGQTASTIKYYAAALGDTALHTSYSLLGDGRLTDFAVPHTFWAYAWRLRLHTPSGYELRTISRAGHESFASYDGTVGILRPYGGKTTDATEINSISSIVLNHCTARPQECGNLTVRHLPNAELDGATYVVLGFWNTSEPSRYGEIFLDATTELPYAAYSQTTMIYFTQWTHTPEGLRYPTEIRIQQPWTEMYVTNIVAGPPNA